MALVKTEAIILRSYKSGETSKLVVLYSPSLGKMKAIAKGARKPTSRFGASLEPITEVSLVIYTKVDRDLQIATQADIISPFWRVKGNVEYLTYGSAICELTDRLTEEGDGGTSGLYSLVRGALLALDVEGVSDPEQIFWYFQLRAAEILGYRPEFERCVICRRHVGEGNVRASVRMGGVLCRQCEGRDSQGVRLRSGAMHFLHGLQRVAPSRVTGLSLQTHLRAEVGGFLRAFLEYHTDDRRRLKTLDFLDKMRVAEARMNYKT
ncbi:MAG: DNA repair protein RecO [Candidatus Latescibacteria bacterium]|nr:DNA repair protein RecO [Candidatus Latescibacterota bacterium]